MAIVLMIIVVLPFAFLALFALTQVAPWMNRVLFDHIWEDPSQRQRKAILARVRELTASGEIQSNTALLMVAKEFRSTDEETLWVSRALDAEDLARLATGRRHGLGAWIEGVDKLFRGR